MRPPPPLEERARAKVNLYLHVGPPRDDGYHPLDSLVMFADAADVLSYAPGDGLSLSVAGPFAADLSDGEDNLVVRAARALAAAAGRAAGGRLTLVKNLPVASGVGGGSADAAAALRLLNRAWGLGLPRARLCALGARLGADVPACVQERPALMRGVGDELAPAPVLPDLWALLVNPGVALSTPAVYRAFDAAGATAPLQPAALPGCGSVSALIAALAARRNDLEGAARALAPVVGETLDALRAAPGALLARMSGSGASCFAIFSTPAAARAAAAALARAHPRWWVAPTRLSGAVVIG